MRIILISLIVFSVQKCFSQKSGIEIKSITKDFYVFTTYKTYHDQKSSTKIPANGMFVVTDSGVALFDTPFDTTQFQNLLDTIFSLHKKYVEICIATHSHDDRTAGLEYYSRKGIKTFTTRMTDEISAQRNEKRAENLLINDTIFHLGQYTFETYYPGKGHASDNIVIWFNKEKLLYGGCFIKSEGSKDLGNLADADVTEWEKSLANLDKKFPKPKYVIPGHFEGVSAKAIKKTGKLVDEYLKRNK
jgi:metallo-beta-lactamase class B